MLDTIGSKSPVIKLIASDEDILQSRILDSSRPSSYRNVDEALKLKKKIISQTFENELCIDITKCVLTEETSMTSRFIASNQSTYY